MKAHKAKHFMNALGNLARSDSSGVRVFKVRKASVCVACVKERRDGTVEILSLISLGGDRCDGRRTALSALRYLADVYDVTLVAGEDVVLRDVGGYSDGADWLEKFGFMTPRGEKCLVRLPQSIQRIAA